MVTARKLWGEIKIGANIEDAAYDFDGEYLISNTIRELLYT